MVDTTTILLAGMGLMVPSTGYVLNKIFSIDNLLAAHTASDEAKFSRLLEDVSEIKGDIKDQSQKLDRLIEQNLGRAQDALIARSAVTSAAATAIEVVEAAKVSALAIVAHAAAEAKKVS